MSICTNFEGALMKAIRSLEQHVDCLRSYDFSALDREALLRRMQKVDDQRIYVIAEALRKGIDYDTIYEITRIDRWFIDKIAVLVEMEYALETQPLSLELLKEAKRLEFPDSVIARLAGMEESAVKQMRYANHITASYKMVDTCAAEFEASTPYYYSCYDGINEAVETNPPKKCLCLAQDRFASGRGLSLTTVLSTRHGHFQKRDMKRLL